MNFSLVFPTQFAEIHKETESDPLLQTLIHQASNSRARRTVLYTTTAHETCSCYPQLNTQNIINNRQSDPLPWTLIHNTSNSRARVNARFQNRTTRNLSTAIHSSICRNSYKKHNSIHCCKCRATKPQNLKPGLMFFAFKRDLSFYTSVLGKSLPLLPHWRRVTNIVRPGSFPINLDFLAL